MRIKRKSRIVIALVLMLTVLMLPGCEGKKNFNASEDLVGKVDLYESVEGLEQVDEKLIPEFVETLNKKYEVEVKDISSSLLMNMDMTITSEELGGVEVDATADMNMDMEQSNEDNLAKMTGTMNMSVMGMSIPIDTENYLDSNEKMLYSKTDGMGVVGEWEKRKMDTEASDMASMLSLKEENILEIYQDPESKAYAIKMKADSETIENSMSMGSASMGEISPEDVDLSKVTCIITTDEGLAVAGYYMDLTDAMKIDSMELKKMTISVVLKDINSGLRIELPEEAKNAVEATDDGGGVFNMF